MGTASPDLDTLFHPAMACVSLSWILQIDLWGLRDLLANIILAQHWAVDRRGGMLVWKFISTCKSSFKPNSKKKHQLISSFPEAKWTRTEPCAFTIVTINMKVYRSGHRNVCIPSVRGSFDVRTVLRGWPFNALIASFAVFSDPSSPTTGCRRCSWNMYTSIRFWMLLEGSPWKLHPFLLVSITNHYRKSEISKNTNLSQPIKHATSWLLRNIPGPWLAP